MDNTFTSNLAMIGLPVSEKSNIRMTTTDVRAMALPLLTHSAELKTSGDMVDRHGSPKFGINSFDRSRENRFYGRKTDDGRMMPA